MFFRRSNKVAAAVEQPRPASTVVRRRWPDAVNGPFILAMTVNDESGDLTALSVIQVDDDGAEAIRPFHLTELRSAIAEAVESQRTRSYNRYDDTQLSIVARDFAEAVKLGLPRFNYVAFGSDLTEEQARKQIEAARRRGFIKKGRLLDGDEDVLLIERVEPVAA